MCENWTHTTEKHVDKALVESFANQKEQVNELRNHLDLLSNPTEEETEILAAHAKKKVEQIKRNMEAICVAPGESGQFYNWGKDTFLEEKAFPEKFPSDFVMWSKVSQWFHIYLLFTSCERIDSAQKM